jgi:hypothetical protein
MTGVTSLLLFVNLIEDRPYWLIFLLSMPVPVYLVTGIMNDGRSERFRVRTIMKDLGTEADVEVEFFKRTRAVKGIRTKNAEKDQAYE